jgi:hypothetical protein
MRLELNNGAGALILALATLPYIIEVLSQLSLQARFVATLPADTRATLPPHPRRPFFVFLGSLRFQLALWRFVRKDLPADPVAVTALKHRMRASLRREALWALLAASVAAVLIAKGWRPIG